MREPKTYWREVPQAVRVAIEDILGAPVRRAQRVFGGYGPSATFRLFLEDGRTAFVKGAGVRATEELWQALPLEEQAYRELGEIRPWAPACFGSVRRDGWHLLLLEDLREATFVPPWRPGRPEAAIDGIAAMHAALLGEEKTPFPRLEEEFCGRLVGARPGRGSGALSGALRGWDGGGDVAGRCPSGARSVGGARVRNGPAVRRHSWRHPIG